MVIFHSFLYVHQRVCTWIFDHGKFINNMSALSEHGPSQLGNTVRIEICRGRWPYIRESKDVRQINYESQHLGLSQLYIYIYSWNRNILHITDQLCNGGLGAYPTLSTSKTWGWFMVLGLPLISQITNKTIQLTWFWCGYGPMDQNSSWTDWISVAKKKSFFFWLLQ